MNIFCSRRHRRHENFLALEALCFVIIFEILPLHQISDGACPPFNCKSWGINLIFFDQITFEFDS